VGRAAARPHGLTFGAATRAAAAVAVRPHLWRTALVEWARLTPRRWWRHWPFLPLPDRDYLSFRMETQYGDAAHQPAPGDLVTWLEWCRRSSV
jgi:hypothetical protein